MPVERAQVDRADLRQLWQRGALASGWPLLKPKQPAGPAMTLGNMRQLGVQNLDWDRGRSGTGRVAERIARKARDCVCLTVDRRQSQTIPRSRLN